jgi:glutamate decarboxylase
VIAQYFMLVRLGRTGYTRVQLASRETAQWLSGEIAELGPYELLSDGGELPVFAFRLSEPRGYTVYDVSELLRTRGWIVPAYRMPPAIDDMAVLRICVRNGFSRDLGSILVDDLRRVTDRLEHAGGVPPARRPRESFHH